MISKSTLFSIVILLVSTAADAAVILERTIEISLKPDGGTIEATHLRVKLETAADADAWARYPIPLNENRELLSVEAWADHADGSRDKVKRKRDRDTVEASSTFHDSTFYEVLTFPGVREGSTIETRYQVAVSPYFPAGQFALRAGEPTRRLHVSIKGHSNLRWRLDGPVEGLEIHETEQGVEITALDLTEIDAPDYAPGGAAVSTVLRYAWNDDPSWQGVGNWYKELLQGLPRADASVRAQARELIAGIEDPRERLETLLAFLRKQVRYVAIEVGIGGYRPTPPEEVLDRRWGDCKDKAMLLIDMLAEAKIEAHPVLIFSGRDWKIDREFPSPFQFNHLIVAVPEGQVPVHEDDPVADGFFFLDPTQDLGGARWLHPGVQDQDALVIAGESALIARTPLRPQHERRDLRVSLTLDEEGAGRGTAHIHLRGSVATGFLDDIASTPPERLEETVRYIFGRYLPGGVLDKLHWQEVEGEVPTIEMSADVRVEGWIQGAGSSPSMRLEGMSAFPPARHFDERDLPMIVAPDITTARWEFTLPPSLCLPSIRESVRENDVGAFRQVVRHGETPGTFTIERKARLETRWVEGEALEQLRELTIEENRAFKRRIRLRCNS